MKLAMLYFLPTITKIRSKVGCPIEPFILQAVDDMDLCKTFPWMNVKERFCAISWMKDHRKMCICKMIQISQTHLSMKMTFIVGGLYFLLIQHVESIQHQIIHIINFFNTPILVIQHLNLLFNISF
ncbi:hypothetical protein YC2023_050888 [Brassica napus]